MTYRKINVFREITAAKRGTFRRPEHGPLKLQRDTAKVRKPDEKHADYAPMATRLPGLKGPHRHLTL